MSEVQTQLATDRAEPYLRIEQVSKLFGQFPALRGVDLEVHEGELICFLGPSGCGKTTLLRCIAGLDVQTEGRVVQAGRDISALPPSERDFGIVFQSYALFPNLTVHRNIAYGLENRRFARDQTRARVAELLELVGLSEEAPKYPAQLSGGQQQRVALARALATWPGLLLLDEPLSALDAKVRVYLRREIRRLQRKLGVTTILVTHDQEEALTMGDRIVVMDHGGIVQVGTPLEIYREPSTPFVADFVGTMNFLPGTVLGVRRLRLGALEVELGRELDGLGTGTEVTVCVRPEDVTVHAPGGSEPGTARAQVDELEFLGAFYRATLAAQAISAEPLVADLSPQVVQALGLDAGSEIDIALARERIRLFPGSTRHDDG